MKYQVVNNKTNEVEEEFFTREDAVDCILFEFSDETHSIIQIVTCQCCDREGHERHDWYGISTGYWCDECYWSNRYKFKKSRYATQEHDGYGERLTDDY